MTNTPNSDPNFDIPFASTNVTLPSYIQNPRRRKRTQLTNNETGSSSSAKRPKPEKEPDPDASQIPQPCTECGKQFSSVKALFGHMRCHPERQWRGIDPPPNHKRETTTTTAASSSSSLVSSALEVEQDVASCLLMMANGGTSTVSSGSHEGRRFECGDCKKVFESHEALDGHRATHTLVQGCSSTTNLTKDPPPRPPPQEIVDQDKRKSVKLVSGLAHRCNVCSRVFSSGQALGGHMRCHWEKDQQENQVRTIDLNLPAATTSSDTGCSLDLRLGL